MWTAIFVAYAITFLLLTSAAGAIAVFAGDAKQGDRAHAVLRTLLKATLGSTGLVAALAALHETGLV